MTKIKINHNLSKTIKVEVNMYTFSVEDEIADIIKDMAKQENRTTRGQFRHLLVTVLQNEGLYTQNQSNNRTKTIMEQ